MTVLRQAMAFDARDRFPDGTAFRTALAAT
jgi:hypothetical protein